MRPVLWAAMLIAALALIGRLTAPGPTAARAPVADGPGAGALGGAGPGGPGGEAAGPSPAYTVPADVARARSHIDRSGGDPGAVLATVFYADRYSGGKALIPVEVKVRSLPARGVERAAALLPLLLEPPADLGLETGVPAGTRARGVRLDDRTGVLTVDLTAAAERGAGPGWASAFLYSFVYTLTGVDGVQAVRVDVDGRPGRFAGWTWDRPLGRADLERMGTMRVVAGVRFDPAAAPAGQ
ncbi:GerMN domain-containing protein [Caldinitratiruptor microaerophilus]|uniref:GerMN domain-containing protein n=1 Tax=Caldinitratiruptor microaerophilus TaxID=671077 RepID=A0AA35CPP8_9FIRM|nr:GerMN domain-containing protein [Caldinitratiruptor microaerophilus]BDG61661.1 hypothetical protein caldi_27510 [Caldinitratiruptor microaerophilus]